MVFSFYVDELIFLRKRRKWRISGRHIIILAGRSKHILVYVNRLFLSCFEGVIIGLIDLVFFIQHTEVFNNSRGVKRGWEIIFRKCFVFFTILFNLVFMDDYGIWREVMMIPFATGLKDKMGIDFLCVRLNDLFLIENFV